MLRVNGVLVVPPFECAWLTGDGYTLRDGSGCVSFEARGDTDVTVILKSTPGAKRLQPLLRQAPGHTQAPGGGGNALQVEQNYTIIFGSHRNSCLKIEKNGVTQCMVTGAACSRVSSKVFSRYWIDFNHGVLTVGHGEPGEDVCHRWHDTQEIPGIQHVGLSCWDRHVSYRAIALQPPLNPARLQLPSQPGAAGGLANGGGAAAGSVGGAAGAVPRLFDATCAAIMAATTPANVCRTLHVAELLLPTTQKLYRYCLDYIARHFEAVAGAAATADAAAVAAQTTAGFRDARGAAAGAPALAAAAGTGDVGSCSGSSSSGGGGSSSGGGAAAAGPVTPLQGEGLHSLTPAAMCDLVCQNTFSVDEQGIFLAVRDWALSYLAAAAAEHEAEACRDGGGSGGGAKRRCPGSRQAAAPGWSGGGSGDGGGRSPASPASPRAPYYAVPALGRVSEPSGSQPLGDAWPSAAPAQGMVGGAWSGGAGPPVSFPGQGTRPSGGSPRRSSAPHLDFSTLSTALAAAAATPTAPGTPPVDPHGPGGGLGSAEETVAAAAAASASAEDEAAVCRVLCLIRFPLLPIPQLHACLEDPLVRRLPAVLDLVNEALEVHRRETGAGLASDRDPRSGSGSGSGRADAAATAATGGGAAAAASGAPYSRSASLAPMSPAAERRLVKPLPGAGAESGAAAAASAAAAPAATAAAAVSVRYQRRCLPFALELEYVCDGDSCGVLHFLGTQYGSQGWVNPMLAKRVDVRASSPTGRTTDPRVVAGRQFVRTNFAGPRYVNGAASSWWQVDLGEQHQLALTYYTLRHDGSPDYVRSWVLQGSHDLASWVDLKRHSNDTTIKLPGQYASWPVIGPAAAVPYRAFRLLLTAPNASPNPATRHNFCLSNLELYGFLHKGGNGGGGSGVPAAGGGGVGGGGGGAVGAAAAGGGTGGCGGVGFGGVEKTREVK